MGTAGRLQPLLTLVLAASPTASALRVSMLPRITHMTHNSLLAVDARLVAAHQQVQDVRCPFF
jgi:hypothetical protein